jgi:SNF2 family DNA or RNA helicase
MGMGKTLMCIAMILGNRPRPEDMAKGQGTTLIVCPASAVRQWELELKQHCRPALRVLVYRETKGIDINVLEGVEILITSYQEVQRSHPSQSVVNELASLGLTPEQYSERLGETLGNLFKMVFHRVILDEGHAIKSYQTATSKAAIHLRSRHHWIVSGTPIQNTLAELYPYLRFLRYVERAHCPCAGRSRVRVVPLTRLV